MSDKKVSILIPLYNAEKWIGETIQSAINQKWKNKEIIIVDDGSTDGSLSIAREFESQFVKVIHQKNRGGSAARNRAFAEAQGEYIQYLDADDVLHPEKTEQQVIKLIEKPDSIASGRYGNFVDTIESATFPFNDGFRDYDKPVEWLIKANLGLAMFPPVVWLTPRKIIEMSGPWNEQLTYNDDTEFFCRVLLNSNSIIYCDQSISYYRRGINSSVGSRKSEKALTSWLHNAELVTSHMLRYENSERVRESCANIYRHIIFSLYPKHSQITKQAMEDLVKLNEKMADTFSKGITKKISRIFGWKAVKWFKLIYAMTK